MAHLHAPRLRSSYEALAAGDLRTAQEHWSDDLTWHVYGAEGPLPGEYRGKQAVLDLLATIPEHTDDFAISVHDVVAGDEHAVALLDVTITRSGITHRAPAVHVYHVDDDGRFVESWHTLLDEQSFPRASGTEADHLCDR